MRASHKVGFFSSDFTVFGHIPYRMSSNLDVEEILGLVRTKGGMDTPVDGDYKKVIRIFSTFFSKKV